MFLSKFDPSFYKNQSHPFHLVDVSPWPFCLSMTMAHFVTAMVMYMHGFCTEMLNKEYALIFMCWVLSQWLMDVMMESTYQGHHTRSVLKGLQYGMMLFMISEIMFFFSFFWSFFYYAMNPSMFIGNVWPPQGVTAMNPWYIPLYNTLILLSSGIFLTLSHKQFLSGKFMLATSELKTTMLLGMIFTMLQGFEYLNTELCMNDSVYGSIFYLATGFHGFHVLVGTAFLMVCLISMEKGHFSPESHFGLIAASWYWHFVDVVWMFLYFFMYLWGSWGAWFQNYSLIF